MRQAILAVDRDEDRAAARARLDLPDDRFVVATMGGSLGSGVLNEALAAYLRDHRDDPGLAVRQVAGERFVDRVERVVPDADGVIHQVVGYEPDMPALYAAADLLVGRGGASTVHEIAVTGIPAILVPWAGAAEDHQTGNVRWLSDVGGAVLLAEDDLDRLGAEIERLRHDGTARAALRAAASQRAVFNRSGALPALIERVAIASPPS